MGYILAEILACLLLAGLIGAILGWWLRGGNKKEISSLKKKLEICEKESRSRIEQITQKYEQKIQVEHDLWNRKIKDLESRYKADDSISSSAQKLTDTDMEEKQKNSDIDTGKDEFNNECYELEDIPGIGAGFALRLKKRGIFNSCYLANRFLNDDEATKKMAKKLDIDFNTLRAWAIMSDLMKHKGLNGDYAEILQAVGISNRDELQRADANHLYSKIKDYIQKYPTPDNLAQPTLDMIKNWIKKDR
jgi:predicted flap endonuclease-1-like 5' DNA nuclease